MNELMNDLMAVLWRQSWQLVVLVLLVYPIAHFSQKRYPRFTYLLWLMVALKTILPFQFTIPVQIGVKVPVTSDMFFAPEVTVWAQKTFQLQTGVILAGIWLTVVLVMAVRLIINESRFRNMLRDQEAYDIPGLQNLIKKFNIRTPVAVAVSHQITMPLTLGSKRPLILVPGAHHHTDKSALLPVIAHELAHIKRRDIWAIGLQVALNILFFFHPLMRLLNRNLDLNRERICDEMALEALGMKPRSYGQELLSHIEASLMHQPQAALSGGMFMDKKNVLKRFEYLLHRKGKTMLKMKISQKMILGVMLIAMGLLACSEGLDNGMDNDPVSPASAAKATTDTYDTPPEPIGGYAAIQQAIVYPELARKAGIHGTVIVQAIVGSDGKTKSTEILRGIPDSGLDEAATDALMAIEWTPGLLQEKPVTLKIAVPVVFRLAEK